MSRWTTSAARVWFPRNNNPRRALELQLLEYRPEANV